MVKIPINDRLCKKKELTMNVLIIGCGKVGSRLADILCQFGHDVSIIALKRESFDLLSDDFSGFTIQGVPIDLDILRQAGIEGFASDDEDKRCFRTEASGKRSENV